MGDSVSWLVPSLVVFGGFAAVLIAAVLIFRRATTGRGARARAARALSQAGADLVALDDAVDELDLELGLAGAMHDEQTPPSLRRARLSAGRVRDDGFEIYRELTDGNEPPLRVVSLAQRLSQRLRDQLEVVEKARAEQRGRLADRQDAPARVAAARKRLTELTTAAGHPQRLVDDLRARIAEAEWRPAQDACDHLVAALAAAEEHLAAAEAALNDPSRGVREDLAEAERRMRAAAEASRVLEEHYRLVQQADGAVDREISEAEGALRIATGIRQALDPVASLRLGGEIDAVRDRLDVVRALTTSEPLRVIDEIARLRDRLDAALADARTSQQRFLGARSALPGAFAAARNALAAATAAVAQCSDIDARVRLDSARAELADARAQDDPVDALDAARRAIQQAQDARALADYARSHPRA